MEKTNLLTLVVTLTVGIILAGSLLMPVITDATTTDKTFTNTGYYQMNHYTKDDEGTYVISWTYNDQNVITVNDEEIPINSDEVNGFTVLIGADTILRAGISGGNVTNIGYFTSNTATYAEVSHSDTLTLTFSEGSYTGTIRGSSVSGTYNDLYIPTLSGGEFVMKKANTPAYIHADSEIVAYGITNVSTYSSTTSKGIAITGSADDLTINVWRGSSGFTTTDPTVHETEVESFKDLYLLDKITFTGTVTETVDDETKTTDTAVTYSYFLVPTEVTAEKAVHFTDGENTLLNALPILIIVGLLMVGVGAIAIRNRD